MEEYQGVLCESGLSTLAAGSASKSPAEVTINEPADRVRKSRRVKPGNFALRFVPWRGCPASGYPQKRFDVSHRRRAFVFVVIGF